MRERDRAGARLSRPTRYQWHETRSGGCRKLLAAPGSHGPLFAELIIAIGAVVSVLMRHSRIYSGSFSALRCLFLWFFFCLFALCLSFVFSFFSFPSRHQFHGIIILISHATLVRLLHLLVCVFLFTCLSFLNFTLMLPILISPFLPAAPPPSLTFLISTLISNSAQSVYRLPSILSSLDKSLARPSFFPTFLPFLCSYTFSWYFFPFYLCSWLFLLLFLCFPLFFLLVPSCFCLIRPSFLLTNFLFLYFSLSSLSSSLPSLFTFLLRVLVSFLFIYLFL